MSNIRDIVKELEADSDKIVENMVFRLSWELLVDVDTSYINIAVSELLGAVREVDWEHISVERGSDFISVTLRISGGPTEKSPFEFATFIKHFVITCLEKQLPNLKGLQIFGDDVVIETLDVDSENPQVS